MTVLRPSLPPPISRTTRTVSLPYSAARAVLARNCGTAGAAANSVDAFSERARKSRRWNIGLPFFSTRLLPWKPGFSPASQKLGFPGRSWVSVQRVLGHGQQGVGRLADPLVAGRA